MATVHCGWLTKEGARVKNWKRRWFVLDSRRRLAYFRDSGDKKKAGAIDMSQCSSIICASRCDCEWDPLCNQEYAFGLVTPARTYHIYASSRIEFVEWMYMLKKAAKIAQPVPLGAPITEGAQYEAIVQKYDQYSVQKLGPRRQTVVVDSPSRSASGGPISKSVHASPRSSGVDVRRSTVSLGAGHASTSAHGPVSSNAEAARSSMPPTGPLTRVANVEKDDADTNTTAHQFEPQQQSSGQKASSGEDTQGAVSSARNDPSHQPEEAMATSGEEDTSDVSTAKTPTLSKLISTFGFDNDEAEGPARSDAGQGTYDVYSSGSDSEGDLPASTMASFAGHQRRDQAGWGDDCDSDDADNKDGLHDVSGQKSFVVEASRSKRSVKRRMFGRKTAAVKAEEQNHMTGAADATGGMINARQLFQSALAAEGVSLADLQGDEYDDDLEVDLHDNDEGTLSDELEALESLEAGDDPSPEQVQGELINMLRALGQQQ